MASDDLNDNLRAITDRFHVAPPMGLLGHFSAPFDVSKPNLHDNKQDFLAEQNAVLAGLTHVEGLLDVIAAEHRQGSVGAEVGKRLQDYVDAKARTKSRAHETEYGHDLVRRNSSEVGLTLCLTLQMSDLLRALSIRKQELRDQEAEFWSGNSRPPNHYARTIALRFARFIAHHTRKKPTFGTSRDGGHPSTDFGRALEEIFALLKIKANVKNAATWAIDQLTEKDFQPVADALATRFQGSGASAAPRERSIFEALK